MTKDIFSNKSMALLLWKKSLLNEDEVSMYCGVLRMKNGEISFERGDNIPDIIIQNQWVDRIKKIPKNLRKDLGNCDYQLSLSVSESVENNGYMKVGLKWLDEKI